MKTNKNNIVLKIQATNNILILSNFSQIQLNNRMLFYINFKILSTIIYALTIVIQLKSQKKNKKKKNKKKKNKKNKNKKNKNKKNKNKFQK